jgi:hypothetical protein
METVMATELCSFYRAEAKEITPLGVWILSRVLIATSTLMFMPFAVYL